MKLPAALNYLLSSGHVLLAFDGLDEILRTSQRRIFVDLVVAFTEQYPLCPVFITSRLIGYDKAPLPKDQFDEIVLGDFPDQDVELYAAKFIRNVAHKKVSEARSLAANFMHQTADNAADLRKNPLMLGLMMWIFNLRNDVPSSRPEVYQECSRLMFERWDADRDIIVELPQTFDRLQVFCNIASLIFGNEDHSGGVSTEWIEASARSYLVQVLESRSEAYAAAKSLVKFIIDRSWVMSEKGEGVFSFTHHTFLEYLFAKSIDDENDTVAELFSVIIPHVREEEWDVVSRLSLQTKTHRNRRREDQAISLIVGELGSENLTTPQVSAVAMFAALCLEFLIASEQSIRTLVVTVAQACLVGFRAGSELSLRPLAFLVLGAKERREFVASVLEEFLISSFETGDATEREFVVACLDERGTQYNFRGELSLRNIGSVALKLPRVKLNLRRTLRAEALRDERSAKPLFEWFGTVPSRAVERHRCDFLLMAKPATSYDLDGITTHVIAASNSYTDVLGSFPVTRKSSERVLSQIGKFALKSGCDALKCPLLLHDLNTPPWHLWPQMIKRLSADIYVRTGALVGFYFELKRTEDRRSGEEPAKKTILRVASTFGHFKKEFPSEYNVIKELIFQCGTVVRNADIPTANDSSMLLIDGEQI